MRVLHILADGPTELFERMRDAQAGRADVHVIDLSEERVPYETVVEEIFSADKVISW